MLLNPQIAHRNKSLQANRAPEALDRGAFAYGAVPSP